MSYCLNPHCSKPENPTTNKYCQNCGFLLLLKERYRALKLIGQGGFGKTFLAIDEDIPSKPLCVIKQFLPQLKGTTNLEKATQLFEQEARQLDKLGKHPQIPELLAHFEQDHRLYLVQQYIDGQNLAEEIAHQGRLSEEEIWQLLNSILPVLDFIHQHQVIHRDIKPENIIRRHFDGQLVLVDFGAAKFANDIDINQTGTVIGTPGYAAPEQTLGKANFSSDIYSLGVTCLHLLTQIEPFDLFDVSESDWVWRDYLFTPINPALAKILDKMVQVPTKKRYLSVSEVLEDVTLTPANSQQKTIVNTTNFLPKLVEINNKYGYINHLGQMTIALKFDQARRFSTDGLAAVRIGNKWGFIDSAGKTIIPPQFNQVLSFSEGLAAFRVGKWLGIKQIWGYINQTGEIVIAPQFSQVANFSEDLALVNIDSQWGYINKSGEMVIAPQFLAAYSFKNGFSRVMFGTSWGFIDKTGQVVIPPRDNARDFSEGLAAVEINKYWGYINQKGFIVIQPQFKEALDFSEGLAPVLIEIKFLGILSMGQKWGYINKDGAVIIDPQFEWASKFSQGLAAVRKNEKWGYINKIGQIVIAHQFDLAADFDNGYAEVMMQGQCRYIDKTGKFIY